MVRTTARKRYAAEIVGVILLVMLVAACGEENGQQQSPNEPPRAMLMAPVRIGTDMPARFDASASCDDDGMILKYSFTFGDGSSSLLGATPLVSHEYSEPGTFESSLVITDDDGASDEARIQLRVVDGFSIPDCGPDLPCPSETVCGCLDDSECSGAPCRDKGCENGVGICYQNGQKDNSL